MAQLVALGGAVIGGAIGGPTGARIGYLVGNIAGNFIFRERQPDTQNEGPRLGDLTITTSAYGLTIPIVYGTVRVPGNIIWSKGIEEVKNTNTVRSGGKGGKKPRHTEITYAYFCTFALGLCEGEVGEILRIWADSKIIYDITGKSGDDVKKHSLNFRFYPGSETQNPDGLIEDDKGVGNTPAFRGLAYVVFDRLPLADFGNRLPSLSFEVTRKFSTSFIKKTLETPYDTHTSRLAVDHRRSLAYTTARIPFGASHEDQQLYVFDLKNFTFLRKQSFKNMGFEDIRYPNVLCVVPSGHIVLETDYADKYGVLDPVTLKKTGEMTTRSGSDFRSPATTSIFTRVGIKNYVYVSQVFKHLLPEILEVHNGSIKLVGRSKTYGFSHKSTQDLQCYCSGQPGEFYELRLSKPGTGSRVFLYKITVSEGAFYDSVKGLTAGVKFSQIAEYSLEDFNDHKDLDERNKRRGFEHLIFDKIDNNLIVIPALSTSSTPLNIVKISSLNGKILWKTRALKDFSMTEFMYNRTNTDDGLIAYIFQENDKKYAYALRTVDGGEFFKQEIGDYTDISNHYFYDSSSKSLISFHENDDYQFVKISLFKGTGEPADLSSIVSDLTLKSDLKADDFSVTGLDGLKVPGYMIARQTTIRAALETLTSAYFFDGIESDFFLKYQPRQGKAISKTLNEDDLVFLDTKTGVIKETKRQEVELPLKFSVTYQNKERDYQQSTHSASRSTAILGGTKSINHHSVSLPLVLEADFSKQLAEKLLYISWIERSSFSFKQNIEHVDLDPGDLFKISMDDGTVFQLRAESSQMGPDLSIESEAVSELPTQYVSNVKADSGDSGIVHEFLSSLETNLFLLDTPLLRDEDSRAREVSQMYFFMAGYGGTGWKNGNLFMSSDNKNYNDVGLVLDETPWGTVLNKVEAPASMWSTDTKSEIHVSMVAGEDELSSTSFDDVLNGTNAGVLLKSTGEAEIIQFKDAVQKDDGTFILKNLLRGRRGTDVFAKEHQPGETFLLLKARAGGIVSFPLDEKGQTRYFKPVLDEGFIEDAPVFQKKLSFNDLKPWSVAQVKAQKRSYNDDIEISWTRRTRIGGGLRDDTGEVPLGEDEEKYEVEILTSDDSVLRTFTGLTREEVTYETSQQKTDGFDRSQNKIRVKIYQMSKQVGRGFAEVLSLPF